MSSYRVLVEASRLLRDTIWDVFQNDPAIFPQVVPGMATIVFSNPTETLQNNANRLSLWLYRIEENEFIKNQPMVRRDGNGDQLNLAYPPLSLDLSYLITPTTGNPEQDLLLLGRTMQVLYENSVLVLSNPQEDVQEELKIILGRISLEELTRIWEALNEPYRLSVCYRVRVTQVDSERVLSAPPVSESARGYGEVPGEEEA